MRKILLSVTTVGLFGLYSLYMQNNPAKRVLSQTTQTTTSVSGSYQDGIFTGNTADAFYGKVQVRATVSNGKITNIEFLDYPRDRRTSIEINTQAMPLLQQEAIQVQNADVDVVSGATDTSRAFIESLSSALNQAGK
jgi:uncharacterized protein with FMN-binding domain